MIDRRLLFVCYPDSNHPIGGVKQIYRQVELLHQQGNPAWVLHENPGFRVDWFASQAPGVDIASYLSWPPSADTDLLVLPETWLSNVPHYLPGIPKVIFNQNAFYTFGLDGQCDANTLDLYRHPDIVGVVTVSHDSRELLVRGCGLEPDLCHVVLNGIDPSLFYVPEVKLRQIVFLGRKHADHIRKVALMARQRPSLQRYPFKELPRLSHSEVAKELRDSLMFLSCGHPEGFGLPLAEAIASGCLVVGYHGLGGRDFALPFMNTVEFGDLLGFVDAIEEEVAQFEQHTEAVTLKRHQASQHILKQFSPAAEREQATATWHQVANRASGVTSAGKNK